MKSIKLTDDQQKWLEELYLSGHVKTNELSFAVKIVRRYDPQKNDNLIAFYLSMRKRTRKREVDEFFDHFNDSAASFSEDISASSCIEPSIDAIIDSEFVREKIGPVAYAILSYRYADSLSVTATAKKMGISRESTKWIEEESLRILRASFAVDADSSGR